MRKSLGSDATPIDEEKSANMLKNPMTELNAISGPPDGQRDRLELACRKTAIFSFFDFPVFVSL